jgi:hypothetical protein
VPELSEDAEESARSEKCEMINFDATCAALAVVILNQIEQHLVSKKVISPQEVAAYASTLESIQNVYAEMTRRYCINPEESCDARKAIADAFNKIEMKRRCGR